MNNSGAADDAPTVAVYAGVFLAISMTFIYRQLLGIAGSWRPIALAQEVENLDVFQFDRVHVKRRSRLGARVSIVWSLLTDRYIALTPLQRVEFARVLRRERAVLIHAHFGPCGLEMLPLARALGIPLLVTFHGWDASMLLRDERYRRNLRRLFRYADVITVSQCMRNRLVALGADPSRTCVHYIGAPVEDFAFVERKPIAERVRTGEPVRFLQVSKFAEKKGHRQTLEAFRLVLEKRPRCSLTLAGEGPLRGEMERYARDLGLGDRVSFPGKVWKETVIPLMAESDVFLHHSVTSASGDEEGIPTVLMEAMATGLPVVSTFHAGIPELVEDGVTGILVPERDIAAYASAMERILGAVDTEMGRRASEFVRIHFNLRTQNEKLAEIYTSVASKVAPSLS